MIRLASLRDERVLQKLLMSIDSDDYVLDHLTSWLKEGSIYAYCRQEEIVGMVRLSYSRDGKAHLGAVRVHPDVRRQGIATALTEHCIAACRTDVVRLAIIDNRPSRKVAEKIGFSPVATFTLLLKSVEESYLDSCSHGTPEEAIALLKNSCLFVKNHSLISSSFTFYEPSVENLKNLSILINGDHVALLDLEVEEALTTVLQVAYCDPDEGLVKGILHEASRKRAQEIWAVVPKDEEIVSILKIHGFEYTQWGETITVFELLV